MNLEAQLDLQAYMDGELSSPAGRKVAEWLAQTPDAQALAAELNLTRTFLAGQELERKVPETREFYWSQIERCLQTADSPAEVAPPFISLGWWLRWVIPVGAAALLTFWLVIPSGMDRPANMAFLDGPEEIDTSVPDTSTVSFHAASEGVTVVWIDLSGLN
jgi:anti-sigma factor RsiW